VRQSIWAVFPILFIALFSTALFAEEIVLIKSQDISIYREAQQGFQSVYPGPVSVLDLAGNSDEGLLLPLKKRPKTIIVAMGLLAARTVQEYLPNHSMVFSMLFDPDRFSLLGENRTGITLQMDPHLLLSKIRTLFPTARKIGILFDPQKTARLVQQAKEAATKQEVTLIAMPVPTEQALPNIARELIDQVDLLWAIPDSTVITPLSLEFLLLLAFEKQVPTIAFSKDLVKRGMVVGFSPDYKAIGEETAQLALLMRSGKRDIPVRSAPKMLLSLNLTTARKIGITWDPSILEKADTLYE
jgi:putative ABC transport system substrate-binding protein